MKKTLKRETIGSYKFFIKYDEKHKRYEVYCNKGNIKPYNGTICFSLEDSLYFYHRLCSEMLEEIFSGKSDY